MNAIFTVFQDMSWKGLASQVRRWALALAAGRAGGLMVETVVAVSLMTLVGTALLSGLSTTHISGAKTERQSMGENIARNVMAHVFSQAYDLTLTNTTGSQTYYDDPNNCGNAYFPYTGSLLSGYSICIDTEPDPNDPTNTDVQKVVVRVRFEGGQVFRLDSMKVE
jgi:hypothetical protein